ncbi:hypothetical protein DICPUDRAFT_53427 [Dictyostelium purpureum]|uniref:N-acyl-aliphatic-L-amino acid amidohydrolase n=1 Tax=Dictyostelium purpureum TaxID=5786 RepID=F0ZCQ8_DICPU|nr:uncharacterized protein DICPUDRAFT_53427 [Dictyostelium purpureum]EGC38242.1 hypothetical protein DICPUDRAFT_53427 [Dictyostelium purpureum]|eukprot:XP_003285199.1 hypothetical protein DICPUDRAFT_53427 [Dictyostelium purpureum]
MNPQEEHPTVSIFREFLQIRTDHPTPDYESSTKFLVKKAEEYGIQYEVYRETGLPIVIMKIEGEDQTLKSVLLNSHVDVVPAVTESWKVNPFAATKDEKGDIYARGTQDMKCVCIQFLEVAHRIAKSGKKLKRNLYLTFVPDEEIGGTGKGMEIFVYTEKFKQLNVGLCLDEGLASPTEDFTVFYGERAPWWVHITAVGNAGHGSRFIEGTAVEKLMRTVNKMLAFRQEQSEKLHKCDHECGKKLGDVTSLNLTVLKAGIPQDHSNNYSYNVVPTQAEAGFDIRIPPTVNLEEFLQQLKDWTAEEGLSFKFASYIDKNEMTKLDSDNKWWENFKASAKALDINLVTEIFPAATDSRFIRNLGIPAFGFSPINNTPILLHDHNEFLNEKVFIRGIDIFMGIIPNLVNME